MLKIGRIGDEALPSNFEKWAIVRSPRELDDAYILVQELAPSPQLFRKYREVVQSGNYNRAYFENVYVPQFVKEISPKTEEFLLQTVRMSRQSDIVLCCYCENSDLCHRSIVAGILMGLGADIQTNAEYIRFFEKYLESKSSLR